VVVPDGVVSSEEDPVVLAEGPVVLPSDVVDIVWSWPSSDAAGVVDPAVAVAFAFAAR